MSVRLPYRDAGIDGETGEPRLLKMVAVDDAGYLINPFIVEGQIHGGLAQGIGQAMIEEVAYGADGQPLTASFMDYALPRASNFPLFDLCATGIATVDDAGAVIGVSGGEAQISATFENRTGSATVTVQTRPPVQQWRGLTIAAENRCSPYSAGSGTYRLLAHLPPDVQADPRPGGLDDDRRGDLHRQPPTAWVSNARLVEHGRDCRRSAARIKRKRPCDCSGNRASDNPGAVQCSAGTDSLVGYTRATTSSGP